MSASRKKSFNSVIEGTKNGKLKRTLGAFDLFLMGMGAIVGTGIFVITGITAAEMSGPAVTVAYLIAGLVCIFVALSYTEVASMMPTSGGVYAYAYVSMGEIFAWIAGWMMTLYLSISAATVASGWSGYVVNILALQGIKLPHSLVAIPSEGGIINLPAIIIALMVTILLIRGTKESVKLNSILVYVKMAAILLFIFIAVPHFNISNFFDHGVEYDDELFASSSFAPFGFHGIIAGAALVFFGYNGFDTLASAAEEAKNPEKDLSIAIISALCACMALYMIVAGILVGIVPFNTLGITSPLAYALSKIGSNMGSVIVATGAVAGMTTVILLQIYAQSRVLFVMSRDGLLPGVFAKIHPKFCTPHFSTIIVGIVVSLIAGFIPLKIMGSLASFGALFSYAMVSVIMLVLRKTEPDAKRPFKCPAAKIVASISTICCLYLMITLVPKVGIYFLLWFVLGLIVYKFYARKRSKMVS